MLGKAYFSPRNTPEKSQAPFHLKVLQNSWFNVGRSFWFLNKVTLFEKDVFREFSLFNYLYRKNAFCEFSTASIEKDVFRVLTFMCRLWC